METNELSHVRCDLCGADDSQRVLEKEGACYAECKRCGFIYAHPRINDPEAFNEEIFQERLQTYVQKNYSAKKQRDYRRELRRLEPFRQNNRLLEIGSNVGGFLFQARQLNWSPIGLEPVVACARYGCEQRGLNIIASTLEEASLPDDHFDAVYSNAVFEHLAAPSVCFQSAFRVLRPGGALYVDTVNYACCTREYLGAGWKLLKPREHLSLYTPATLRAFCEKAGFEVLRMQTNGVRFRTNEDRKLRGLGRLREELAKFPISLACRFTLKGDSITVLARKPSASSR
ncbi:MAG: class I SAM-dependent methyltransferase [Verrucomicrobia bacterium]|nr:class I SAM-dependent methyltransferase [Verrucomicrobiota bacterium]